MTLHRFTAISIGALIVYTIAYYLDDARLSWPVVVIWLLCVIGCAVAYFLLQKHLIDDMHERYNDAMTTPIITIPDADAPVDDDLDADIAAFLYELSLLQDSETWNGT